MRKFTLLAVFGLFMLFASAQQKTISGRVTDKGGLPVEGASISLKGTTTGTVAQTDGTFKINAKNGDVIVVNSVNYKPREIKITSQTLITVALEGSLNLMDEVIVTAGGIKSKRREVGTASSTIKADALIAGKATNIAAGLQGKVAGLQISGTGSGVNPNYRLILRGQRSLTGNNQALIVLDNVIVPNELLGNLNPEDVEDVTILNGAGAAALYGSQASNGAVIVTTKKGRRGATNITVSNTTTLQSVAFFPKIQKKFGAGGSAYGTDLNAQPTFSNIENQSYGPAFDGTKKPLGSPLENGMQDSALYAYSDGHNRFWQTGVTNQTDFSLSTGDDKSTFYLSGQYADVTGTTPGDKYNRTSIRLNGTRSIANNKLNVSYGTNYTQNRYNTTTQTGSMYANMLNMPSNVDITKYKNWRTDPLANPNGFYNPWYQNPYFTADNNRSLTRNDYLTANVELKFNPIKGVNLVARQGLVTRNFSNKNSVGAFTYTTYAKQTEASAKTDIAASVSDGSGYTTQLLSDLFGQFNANKGDFSFGLIAGGQWRQDESKNVGVSANGLVIPGLFNVNNGVGTPGASESSYKARQIGAYADGRIGFRNFLYLHGTVRNDWVSILDPANRSFFYPSVDLSFIASDAIAAVKNSNIISFLKLSGGWSKVGQVNLGGTYGAYQLLPTYNTANGFPYGSVAGYTVGNTLVSNNLKPEITKGYEANIEFNLFRDRLVSKVTWYSTKTDNQTVVTSLSNSTGFSNLRTNTGQTMSRGLEVTSHVTPLKSQNWNITVGGNYTYLDNKVNSISAELSRLALATYGSTAGSYAVPGQPFPVIMGYDYKRDGAGHVIVDNITGLPTKSDTISVLGSAVAKNRLSFDGSVSYRNLTLSFLFEYRGGAQIFNSMGAELDWSGTGYRTAMYDRQRFVYPNSVIADAANPGKYVANTNVAIKNGNGNNGFWTDGINRDVSSNYVTSADFWKLREIALSYDLPATVIGKARFLKGVRISAQARNLFMWMAKDNYYTDPEYSDGGNDSNGIGLTGIGQAPPARYYGGTISFRL